MVGGRPSRDRGGGNGGYSSTRQNGSAADHPAATCGGGLVMSASFVTQGNFALDQVNDLYAALPGVQFATSGYIGDGSTICVA